MTQALDDFDLEAERPLAESLGRADIDFLLLPFSSDWLYPSYQLADLADGHRAGRPAGPSTTTSRRTTATTRSSSSTGAQTPVVRAFLESIPAAPPAQRRNRDEMSNRNRGSLLHNHLRRS